MDIKKLVSDTIDIINKMTELFYQQKNKEAMKIMDNVLNCLVEVSNHVAEREMSQNGNNILAILANSLKAYEEKDYVLLADILRYDMVDELLMIQKKCKFILGEE